MLQFSLSVLGVDVFVGLGFEGVSAEGRKARSRQKKMRWKRRKHCGRKEEKQRNRKDPGPDFQRLLAPCFRCILVCVIYQTCALAWKHNSPVIWITLAHTQSRTHCQHSFCVISEMFLRPLCICIWGRIMQMTEIYKCCWLFYSSGYTKLPMISTCLCA